MDKIIDHIILKLVIQTKVFITVFLDNNPMT